MTGRRFPAGGPVGAVVPNSGPLPLRYGVPQMARAVEAAGAASLWVSDHVLMVDQPVTDYPYSADGRLTWDVADDYLEALTTCAFLAAATTSCLVGTAALVLPQRGVLQLAKEVATLDRLSGGRFVLGVGAGWNAAEMAALGFDPTVRGRRFDEMLAVLADAWSGRPRAVQGDTLTVPPDVVLHPTPVDPQGPPLLVGGMTRPAVRRAATAGDGWLALAFVERWDAVALAAGLQRFRELRRAHSGDDGIAVLKLHCTPSDHAELAGRACEALDMGFDHVAVEPPWSLGTAAAAEVVAEAVSAAGAAATAP